MAYVAMTRGRHYNEAFVYQKFSQEADHEHAKPVAAPAIHQLRRGTKHAAAYYSKQILYIRPHDLPIRFHRNSSGGSSSASGRSKNSSVTEYMRLTSSEGMPWFFT